MATDLANGTRQSERMPEDMSVAVTATLAGLCTSVINNNELMRVATREQEGTAT